MSIASVPNPAATSTPLPQPPQRQLRPADFWTLLALIVVAGLLRFFASGGDLWMDEVSSWQIAQHATSPIQILTSPEAHTDRNHPLNTFVFYVLGDRNFWAVYRIFSLACGIASVVLVGRILLRLSFAAAVVGTLLTGCSYALLTYSAEAAGYAPMTFFALLAYWAMQREFQKPEKANRVVFNVACILGLLSNICFIQFYTAAVIYWVWTSFKHNRGKAPVASLVSAHLAPILFLVLYAFVFIRHLPPGASQAPLVPVLSTLALIVGGPAEPWLLRFTGYVSVLTIVGFIASLDWLRTRRGTDLLLWFILVLFVGPAVQLLIVRRPADLSPGSFLIPMAFALILFAMRLAAMMHSSPRERYLAAGLLTAMLVANLVQIGRCLFDRHTQYSDAMYYMGRHTDDPTVTITARSTRPDDLDAFQDMLNYYARALPEGKTLVLDQPPENLPAPQWLVVKTRDVGGPATPELNKIILQNVGPHGATYVFDHEFPYYGLPGSSWEVYRLEVGR